MADDFAKNMKNQRDTLKEVAGWSDPTFTQPPTNVTGSPPAKGVANMAADQAEKAASFAQKLMEARQ
jgi:hypothetical protein